MTAAIAVDGLTKHFGDLTAVDHVTFDVPYGAITGFVGANGSGKTTTMRMLVGLTVASSGSALIAGQSHGDLPDPRAIVGCVLNRLGAHPGLTGRRHLQMVSTDRTGRDDAIERVLDEVGLTDAAKRRIGKYSTGMKQRLSLAAALLYDPPIFILDEPASGLDPGGIRWLRELLRDRADKGAAVFVSTHQLAELAIVVDNVVVIDRGRVIATAPASELLTRTGEQRLDNAVLALTDRHQAVVS